MFTGIIEEIGTVESVRQKSKGLLIEVKAPRSSKELALGDSISINGVCQTVVRLKKSSFIVEAVEETLKKTNFKNMTRGDKVNIELPLKSDGRFGGHIVLGHVDTVGKIIKIERRSDSTIFQIEYPRDYQEYIVPVGSICVDGVSLTVADSRKNVFMISIIPHTLANTTMKWYKSGTTVNLEFDIVGKYIAQILKMGKEKIDPPIEMSSLRRLGY